MALKQTTTQLHPMTIPLHINTKDRSGGAAIAAHRLHKAMKGHGIESKMVVQSGYHGNNQRYPTKRPNIASKIIYLMEYAAVVPELLAGSTEVFSPGIHPSLGIKRLEKINHDIVHLHWINGFLSVTDIGNIKKPIIWTLHDMWAFTGGCHYSYKCDKYKTGCIGCPQLLTGNLISLSERLFRKKQTKWEDVDMTIVCPSEWLGNKAESSAILGDKQIEVIPNCINLEEYHPSNKCENSSTPVSEDKITLLFGADTQSMRKGSDLFINALNQTNIEKSELEVVIFGGGGVPGLDNTKFQIIDAGFVSEPELRKLYAQSDAVVIPSREDNLPNTAVEALASGTPCIGFAVGGIQEIIKHKETGFLCGEPESQNLREGIEWLVAEKSEIEHMSVNSRAFAEEKFRPEKVVSEYYSIYRDIV